MDLRVGFEVGNIHQGKRLRRMGTVFTVAKKEQVS